MGKIRFGFVLTLLVALLVLAAGWHLAHQSSTKITPVKRETIDEFSKPLPGDADALVLEREREISEMGGRALMYEKTESLELLKKDPAVRGVFLFREGRKIEERIDSGGIGAPTPPEVVALAQKVPLNPERALVLEDVFFDELAPGGSGVIWSKDREHLGYWHCPQASEVRVMLLEAREHRAELLRRFEEKMARPFGNLMELGQRAELVVAGTVLLSEKPEGERSPTMEISRDSMLGLIRVRAWQEEEVIRSFHASTMWVAALLAMVLVGSGGVLFLVQKKSWAESERRVSFVNRVSHELGTPLTNMALNLELAARTLRSQPEAAGKRLEKVREEVSRLGRLVTNVLTHSKKEREGIRSHQIACDPDQVILGVIEQFRPSLERRGIEVDWQSARVGEALVDADGLSQVVWNLISNVEKYASSGKWLGVEAGMSQGDLKVRVCDRGEGIARGKRGKVFDPFSRLGDSASEGVSGTGLGLTISRDLAEAMGGRLALVDDPEMTIFELIIPMQVR